MISIIVAIYNISDYLIRCINSIISQDYKDIEIILVDDGSTDGSGEICDEYAKKEDRIRVIHQKNQGLVCARKKGIEFAKGDYIGFVDGDDYIEKNMYSELLKTLIQYDADFVHSIYGINDHKCDCNENTVFVQYETKREKIDFIKNSILLHNSELIITPSIWSKLFKSEVIKECYKHVPNDGSYGEDLMALCVCVLLNKRFVYLPKQLYHYNIRANSMSNSFNHERIEKEIFLARKLKNIFLNFDCLDLIEETLNRRLDGEMIRHIVSFYGEGVDEYECPYINKLFGKKIVLFGAGRVGRSYYSQFKRNGEIKIIGCVDSYPNDSNSYMNVSYPDSILRLAYDYVVIAVEERTVVNTINIILEKMHVPKEKILWEKPVPLCTKAWKK